MAVYTGSVGHRMLLIVVYIGSVGASGSSPALCRRGIDCGLQGWCCGRPSSRPYSYAVEAFGVINGGLYSQGMGQVVVNCGLYRQCRGEWKLACVASAGGRVVDCGVVCDIPGRE